MSLEPIVYGIDLKLSYERSFLRLRKKTTIEPLGRITEQTKMVMKEHYEKY